MKTALIVRKDFAINKFLAQAFNELGYENVEIVHSFTEAVKRIRQGVDAVITGLYLDTNGETGYGKTAKSGTLVARTAKDSGVPHVALATLTPEALDYTDKELLKGIKVINLESLNRKNVKSILAKELFDDSIPTGSN